MATELATEWLYSVFQLYQKGKREAPNLWDFERAVQMEKQHIMDAYAQGVVDEANEILDVCKDAEEYFDRVFIDDRP
jgi:hypothetical protein